METAPVPLILLPASEMADEELIISTPLAHSLGLENDLMPGRSSGRVLQPPWSPKGTHLYIEAVTTTNLSIGARRVMIWVVPHYGSRGIYAAASRYREPSLSRPAATTIL